MSSSMMGRVRSSRPNSYPRAVVGRVREVGVERRRVGGIDAETVGFSAHAISQTSAVGGQSPLGNLAADAALASMRCEVAVLNAACIRADLPVGAVTSTHLRAAFPDDTRLIGMTLTGDQIYELLESQWHDRSLVRPLCVAGLAYTWEPTPRTPGHILQIRREGHPIERDGSYTVATTDFLALGGDGFTPFLLGRRRQPGLLLVDSVVDYIMRMTQPFAVAIDHRSVRIN